MRVIIRMRTINRFRIMEDIITDTTEDTAGIPTIAAVIVVDTVAMAAIDVNSKILSKQVYPPKAAAKGGFSILCAFLELRRFFFCGFQARFEHRHYVNNVCGLRLGGSHDLLAFDLLIY